MIIMKNINKFLIHTILLALTLLLLFVSLNANFAIDNTTSGGIKDAISNANSGDKIFLDSGIYTGDNNTKIAINKSITLQGNGSVDTVIIDAQKTGRIFTLNSNNITFINITFFNGYVGGDGGAISSNNFANITFINCKFINNTATSYGGAIFNNGNNFSVINCTFINNEANNGGAFYTRGDNSTIIKSNFINNSAGYSAGAISYGNADNFKIKDSIFIDNTAKNSGGAIYGLTTRVSTIINSTFTNNSVTNDYSDISGQYAAGAIYAFNNNLLTIINSTFTNNSATRGNLGWFYGGAIYIGGYNNGENNLTIINTNFTNNTALVGGAIEYYFVVGVAKEKNMNIFNSSFTNNKALLGEGGAIRIGYSNLTISNSNFINNTAENDAGGAINSNSYLFTVMDSNFMGNNASGGSYGEGGGAIYHAVFSGDMYVFNSNFTNNRVLTSGGAIMSEYNNLTISNSNFINNTASARGGAIINGGGNLNINDSNFTNNNAVTDNGGAIVNSGGNSIIEYSTFTNNNASSYGGAIYNSNCNISINNSTFNSNNANYGGAISKLYNNLSISGSVFSNNSAYSTGGAIINSGGNSRIDDSTFTNNKATTSGGAIYNYNNVNMSNIIGSSFVNNTASNYGGVIYNNAVNMSSIYNSNFTNNTASNYYGGAIYNTATVNMSNIYNSSFTNNKAVQGGAIQNTGVKQNNINNSTFTNNTANMGGAITISGGNSNITGSNFTNNRAADSGGAFNTFNNANMSIFDSNFVNNTAVYYGGAIYNYRVNRISINNSSFTNNKAAQGGAIQDTDVNQSNITNSNFNNNIATFGGAIITSGGNSSISGSNFTDNNASSGGGAIYNFGGANMSVFDSNFTDNNASYGGGIYNNATLNVSGNIMFGNFASILGNVIYNGGSIGVLNLTYLNNSTIKANNNTFIDIFATLTDDMNNPITGLNITFYLNNTLISNLEVIEGYLNVSYFVGFEEGSIIPVTGDYSGIGAFNINILDGELLILSSINSTIIVSDVNIGENITIVGQLADYVGNGSDILNVSVDGNLYDVIIDSVGFWSLNYTTNRTGNITVVVSYLGNDNYTSFTNTTTFEVFKNSTNSTIIVFGSFKFGNNVTIGGVLSDENGNFVGNVEINVTLNGQAFNAVTDSVGAWNLNHIFKNSGNFLISVHWDGNDNYTGFTNQSMFYVDKSATNSTIVVPNNIIFGKTITFNGVILDENDNFVINTTILIALNNDVFAVRSNDVGAWSLNYTPINVGNVDISAIWYGGNSVYLGFVNDTSFNVDKAVTNSTIAIPENVIFGKTFTLSGILTDENGNIVANAPVSVFVNNGLIGTVTTDGDGVWSLNYTPDNVAIFNVSVNWSGNDNYTGFTNQSNFSVYKASTNSTITVPKNIKFGKNTTFSGILTDENGNIVANASVSVFVNNGLIGTVTTDGDGVWSLNYTPDNVAIFNVSVNWDGNDNYTGFTNQSSFYVHKAVTNSTIAIPENIIFGKTITLNGVLLDENGNFVINTTILIALNNNVFAVRSDSVGAWSLNYTPTNSGNINISAIWSGNDIYLDFVNDTSFNVDKAVTNSTIAIPENVIFGKTFTLSGILTDENGNIVANAPVSVFVNNGLIGTVTTNSNGVWKLSYTPKKADKNTIKVFYAGNEVYNGFNISKSFKVAGKVKIRIVKITKLVKVGKYRGLNLYSKTYSFKNLGTAVGSKDYVKYFKNWYLEKLSKTSKIGKYQFKTKSRVLKLQVRSLGVGKQAKIRILVTYKRL